MPTSLSWWIWGSASGECVPSAFARFSQGSVSVAGGGRAARARGVRPAVRVGTAHLRLGCIFTLLSFGAQGL